MAVYCKQLYKYKNHYWVVNSKDFSHQNLKQDVKITLIGTKTVVYSVWLLVTKIWKVASNSTFIGIILVFVLKLPFTRILIVLD